MTLFQNPSVSESCLEYFPVILRRTEKSVLIFQAPEQWAIWIGPAQQAVSGNLCNPAPCRFIMITYIPDILYYTSTKWAQKMGQQRAKRKNKYKIQIQNTNEFEQTNTKWFWRYKYKYFWPVYAGLNWRTMVPSAICQTASTQTLHCGNNFCLDDRASCISNAYLRNITIQNPQFSYGQGVIMGSQVRLDCTLWIWWELKQMILHFF